MTNTMAEQQAWGVIKDFAMAVKVKENNRGQQGFTLLELLIAIAIMTVGLLAVATMQGVAMRASSVANKMSVGTMLARQAAEEMLSRNSTDPVFQAAASGLTYDLDPNSTATTVTVPGAGVFSAQYSITPNTPIAGTTQIIVTVTPQASPINPAPAQYTLFKSMSIVY